MGKFISNVDFHLLFIFVIISIIAKGHKIAVCIFQPDSSTLLFAVFFLSSFNLCILAKNCSNISSQSDWQLETIQLRSAIYQIQKYKLAITDIIFTILKI